MAVVVCSCGKRLNLRDELAGKNVRCPECRAVIAVPAAAPASKPPRIDDAVVKSKSAGPATGSGNRPSASPKRESSSPERGRPQTRPARKAQPQPEEEYGYESWDDSYSDESRLPPASSTRSRSSSPASSSKSGSASTVLWIVLAAVGGGFVLVCGIGLLGFLAFLANRPSGIESKISEFATTGGDSATGSRQTLVQARAGFRTNIISSGEPFGPPDDPTGSEFDLIKYQSPAGMLHAYVTKDPGNGQRHPAIVWITGGDCNSIGDVWSPADPENDQTASPFRRAGVAMMFPSLRGGNDNPGQREGFLGEVDDVLAAADHLSKLPYIDPNQIYLGGHSTGGTLSMLVAETSNRFKAVFSLGPVAMSVHYGGEYVYCDPSNEKENALRSPLPWLHCVTSPLYVFEGASDGNWDSIVMMETLNTNPQIHFFKVNGHDHFSIISPLTTRLAEQVKSGQLNITSATVSGL